MPAGVDLRAILAATTPTEFYTLAALIARAEPTGQAGTLLTDATAAELAEMTNLSADTIDRALNGDKAHTRGLTGARLVAEAGRRGRRLLRAITLPMHGQSPTRQALKPNGTLHNIHSPATMPDYRTPGNRAGTPNDPATVPDHEKSGAATVPDNAKSSAATVPDQPAIVRQPCRTNPPAFNQNHSQRPRAEIQQQQRMSGPREKAANANAAPEVLNNRADTDAAREALAPELAQPVAERLCHIVPLAVVRAALKKADAQAAGRGFRTSRRDFVYKLLTSADFHAEALADAQAAEARAAATTAKRSTAQATRQKAAAAALAEAESVRAVRDRETAALNQIIEDMPDERITAILAEIVAEAPEWRLAARAGGGARAAVHRPGLRAAFIARYQLIQSGEVRTVQEPAE